MSKQTQLLNLLAIGAFAYLNNWPPEMGAKGWPLRVYSIYSARINYYSLLVNIGVAFVACLAVYIVLRRLGTTKSHIRSYSLAYLVYMSFSLSFQIMLNCLPHKVDYFYAPSTTITSYGCPCIFLSSAEGTFSIFAFELCWNAYVLILILWVMNLIYSCIWPGKVPKDITEQKFSALENATVVPPVSETKRIGF